MAVPSALVGAAAHWLHRHVPSAKLGAGTVVLMNVTSRTTGTNVSRTASVEPVNDDLLLAGFASGDPEAAREFVCRFQRTVYGVALTVVGRNFADDVAQSAFERIWRQADSYDSRRGSVRTWLVRIVHNIAVDTLRANRAIPVDDHEILSLLAAVTETPEDIALASEATVRLRRALAQLPESQARAVLMATVYGWTAQDIADRETIPVGTAKTRIRSAIKKLQVSRLGQSRVCEPN